MQTYIIGTIFSILISIIIKKIWGFKNKKAIKMFISILPLTIIAAIRYDVGWDYLNIYTMGYYLVGRDHMKWFTEPLFRVIIRVLYVLFKDPVSLFTLMSLLISFFFSLCYKSYEKGNKAGIYILLFVITRYFFCSLNIMRQALAMIIILYAVQFIAKKKFWKYMLYVLLASGFHLMSIIYMPLYFLLSKDFKKRENVLLVLIVLPFILIVSYLFVHTTKYSNYFDTMFGNDGTIFYTELILSIAVLLLTRKKYNKIREDKNNLIFFNMQLLTFLACVMSFYLPTADRIIWYFSINNLFFIPILLEYKENKKYISSAIIYVLLIAIFINQSIINDSYAVLPYQNIIEHRKNK